MKKTFHGSCHCKKVRFEADLDLSAGTGKCNCAHCWKARNWSMIVKPEQVRFTAGESELTAYTVSGFVHFKFCKHCGVRVGGSGDIPELGGAYASVMLPALDDLDPAELVAAPVRYFNGKENDWMTTPRETRHL